MARDFILTLWIGFALDLIVGDPEWFPHPVRLIGKYISYMEKKLRARGGNLRVSALWLTASTVLLSMAAALLILWPLSRFGRWPLLIGMSLINWTGLSMRCLSREARGVKEALKDGVEAGRARVSRIVGRDTASLSEEEIVRATVETVAENCSDGVIAPLFYGLIGGPVLLAGFKAASTLDSMVGYLDPKYKDIGWSSARLDDLLNYLPARITACLLCAAAFVTGQDAKNALRVMRRDHNNHLSPNCAWPESAAAGALNIRLGGTHSYFGAPVYKPTIGDGNRRPERADIDRMNRMMYAACAIFLLLSALPFFAL